jgi:hypothetical protein
VKINFFIPNIIPIFTVTNKTKNMTAQKIKRVLVIGFIAMVSIIVACSCTSKESIAPQQQNGLNYRFLEYIGPDSAMLYVCAYQASPSDAGQIFLTIPKHKNDPQTSVSWSVKSGKSTYHYTNQVMDEKSKFGDIDTSYMQVTKKLVPETVMVVRYKK